MKTAIQHRFSIMLRRAALAVALAAGAGMSSAGTVHVAIDTSTFGAPSGYLDMQLSASSGVPLASALVSNMVGFDSSAFIDAFGVTPVAGGYLFRNDTSNDLFHAVSFGGVLSFDLTFAGEHDPLTTYQSRFLVSAFDENIVPLGAYDPVTGGLAEFTWTPALSAGGVASIDINVADENVTVVSEPSDLLLMAAGLAVMGLLRRRPRLG